MNHTYWYRSLGLVLSLTLSALAAWGQSISDVEREYKEMVALRSDTSVTKDQFYERAKMCCLNCQTVIRSLPSSMEEFPRCQLLLKSLYSIVRSGAAYHSQEHRDSIAIDYAQLAVEIAMMKEMASVELRKKPDYPNFVYYVASRTYNAAQSAYLKSNEVELFIPAIKYLQEYLDVTDPSQHARVLSFFREAQHLVAQSPKARKNGLDVNKNVPDFDVFAKASIIQSMEKWKQKDPYETVAEYQERVNEETALKKQKELQDILMQEYVERYSYKMNVSDMQLKPYDADNQAFLIDSPYGNIVLSVPRGGDEARDFEKQWADIKVYNQNFVIVDKKLALAGLTFSTPAGKIYNYSNQLALAYNETKVDANFVLVDDNTLANSDPNAKKAKIEQTEVVVGVSDVDINIPKSRRVNDNTFAVIIANEKYTLVPQVPMAGNDGRVFAEYCEKTLGLPKENILLYPEATFGKMIRAMKDIKEIAEAYNKIRVIFFYAGHGVPNESSHDAFLLPIDADGKQTEVCYPLKRLYSELAALGTESVVVFIDACFSGATGDGKSLMASARAVEIETNEEEVNGNMVIFSATTSGQTAYPYKEHNHGLFTYFLLKKLQDSKGNTTLGDLSSYIIDNVKQKSVLINHKIQTPTVTPSANLTDHWQKMKLK